MGGLCKEKGRIDGFRVEVCGLIDVLEVTVADCKAFFFVTQIIAEWQGDFSTTSHLPSFSSKYLLVPDWRVSPKPEVTKKSQQILVGLPLL